MMKRRAGKTSVKFANCCRAKSTPGDGDEHLYRCCENEKRAVVTLATMLSKCADAGGKAQQVATAETAGMGAGDAERLGIDVKKVGGRA